MLKSIIILFTVLPIIGFSQIGDKTLTKTEQFSLQSGTLIERQFIDVGKLKELVIRVLKARDLNGDISYSALRFELSTKSTYSSDTKIASLDGDEIDDLIKSINNLQTNIFPTSREVYTEVTYRTKAGFSAGAFYSVDKSKWFAYLQLDNYGSDNTMFLTVDDFQTLLNLITLAKQKM